MNCLQDMKEADSFEWHKQNALGCSSAKNAESVFSESTENDRQFRKAIWTKNNTEQAKHERSTLNTLKKKKTTPNVLIFATERSAELNKFYSTSAHDGLTNCLIWTDKQVSALLLPRA